jgi:hypothetical protein
MLQMIKPVDVGQSRLTIDDTSIMMPEILKSP